MSPLLMLGCTELAVPTWEPMSVEQINSRWDSVEVRAEFVLDCSFNRSNADGVITDYRAVITIEDRAASPDGYRYTILGGGDALPAYRRYEDGDVVVFEEDPRHTELRLEMNGSATMTRFAWPDFVEVTAIDQGSCTKGPGF